MIASPDNENKKRKGESNKGRSSITYFIKRKEKAMFGFRRKEERSDSAGSPASTPPKKPEPSAPHSNVIQLGVYNALSEELGFLPAQLLEEQIRQFLSEHEIPTYNNAEVDAYLTHAADLEGKAWIWRPLRDSDKRENWQWSGHESASLKNAYRGHGSYRGDESQYRPYDKAVPLHILQRVKKIQDRFGGKVAFLVSDYAVPNPDPFIMVTALDVSRIVFGVWDEPAFEGGEEK